MAEIHSEELMDGSALLVSGNGYESEELEICLMVKSVSFHEWIWPIFHASFTLAVQHHNCVRVNLQLGMLCCPLTTLVKVTGGY